jgi:hypothetical protein
MQLTQHTLSTVFTIETAAVKSWALGILTDYSSLSIIESVSARLGVSKRARQTPVNNHQNCAAPRLTSTSAIRREGRGDFCFRLLIARRLLWMLVQKLRSGHYWARFSSLSLIRVSQWKVSSIAGNV